MTAPLLHLINPAEWRRALAAGAVAPPSLREQGFVHLSSPAQVALPADRLFHGRADLVLLVLDPDRIDVPVKWEPGLPSDPASMRFPHAYGPVPTSAVLAVLPYRPRPGGGFDAPVVPPFDGAGRHAVLEPSLLRRAAASEIPVDGGVAVLTGTVPESYQHNQLLIDVAVEAGTVVAEADRALGGAGLSHRKAQLSGAHLAPTAAGLAELGWKVEELVGMVAAAGGPPSGAAEQLDRETLRPLWDADWRRDYPGIGDAAVAQLTDRYRAEEAVIDMRYLAVRSGGELVASCKLKIDGGTALLDMVDVAPAHRGHGHGDTLLAEARAVAGSAGCDLVVLDALASDWPRGWYARRGFTDVGRSWEARRT